MTKIKIFITTIFLIFTFIPINKAAACDFYTSPWFIITNEIDQSKLPDNIEVITQESSNYEGINAITLINHSDKPVELVRLSEIFNGDINNLKSTEYFPRYKLVSNKVYFYDELYDQNHKAYRDWREYTWLQDKGLRIDYSTLSDITAWKMDARDNGWNKSGDNRPADVKIPEPETHIMTILRDGKTYRVPITLRYQLNEYYNPQSVAKGEKACADFDKTTRSMDGQIIKAITSEQSPFSINTILIILCCLGTLSVLGGVGIIVFFRIKKPTSQSSTYN